MQHAIGIRQPQQSVHIVRFILKPDREAIHHGLDESRPVAFAHLLCGGDIGGTGARATGARDAMGARPSVSPYALACAI